MAEGKRSPIGDQKNTFGYGAWLCAPEAFVGAAIGRNFCPIRADVDWVNLRHEARVALFLEDKAHPGRPEKSGRYWWAILRAVGAMLRQEYGVRNNFMGYQRKKPVNFSDAEFAEEAAAADVYRRRHRAEDPARIVEDADWREHHLALAEGVILDDQDAEQARRDWQVFQLWVSGYSTVEIAEHPDTSLSLRSSVDMRLRHILHKLWDYFGVDPKEQPMFVGRVPYFKGKPTGLSPKARFLAWIARPGVRERHNANCRERIARKRAAAKVAKQAQKAKEEESSPMEAVSAA